MLHLIFISKDVYLCLLFFFIDIAAVLSILLFFEEIQLLALLIIPIVLTLPVMKSWLPQFPIFLTNATMCILKHVPLWTYVRSCLGWMFKSRISGLEEIHISSLSEQVWFLSLVHNLTSSERCVRSKSL